MPQDSSTALQCHAESQCTGDLSNPRGMILQNALGFGYLYGELVANCMNSLDEALNLARWFCRKCKYFRRCSILLSGFEPPVLTSMVESSPIDNVCVGEYLTLVGRYP